MDVRAEVDLVFSFVTGGGGGKVCDKAGGVGNLGLGSAGSASISTVQWLNGSASFLAVPLSFGALTSRGVSSTRFRFSTTGGGRGGPPPFFPICDLRK